MLSQLDILAFSQTIQDFYQNNKNIIKTLVVSSGGLVAVGTAFYNIIKSVRKKHRSRRIPGDTFAFEVIEPQSKQLKQRIFGGKYDDSLADHNIPYQQRVTSRNIRRELQQILEDNRWLLILGRTGLGKTREAVELAERYNNLGWTVFYFKPGEWLDVSAGPPKEFGTGRKLLFLLDDLNRRMYRSGDEKNPRAKESLSEPLNVPLQERLLNSLKKYEHFCGRDEILVIATARNEKESQFEGELSPWEQLQWEKYSKLWQRFTAYDLPEPLDDAIVDVLAAIIPNTNIKAKPEQYLKIASSNDRTFRNVIENLRRLRNDGLPLNPNTYRPSLGKTWEKRYREAVSRYPTAKYIYDAVDLLRQLDISIERFVIEPTANLIVRGNTWQRFWCRFKIRYALNYLVEIERIESPRDGQIEAKEYQVEASEYVSMLSTLICKLIDKYPEKLENSLINFGRRLGRMKGCKETLDYFNKLITLIPQEADVWIYRGIVLKKLERYEEAIASYEKALIINPSNEVAWNNMGVVLMKLERYEEAIASYEKALGINYDDVRSVDLGRSIINYTPKNVEKYSQANTSFYKGLEINPSHDYAWFNRGNALMKLKYYSEAIISFDKGLEINSSYNGYYNKGCCYALQGNINLALENLEKAISLNSECREIASTEPDFSQIRSDERFKALIESE